MFVKKGSFSSSHFYTQLLRFTISKLKVPDKSKSVLLILLKLTRHVSILMRFHERLSMFFARFYLFFDFHGMFLADSKFDIL